MCGMDWYDSGYGALVGFCEYSNIFNFKHVCASGGWDGMVWCEVRGRDVLCRELHVVHVILLSQTSSSKIVGKE